MKDKIIFNDKDYLPQAISIIKYFNYDAEILQVVDCIDNDYIRIAKAGHDKDANKEFIIMRSNIEKFHVDDVVGYFDYYNLLEIKQYILSNVSRFIPFLVLHEIAHLKGFGLPSIEKDYEADVWAYDKLRELIAEGYLAE
jgi:hypothetical protein